MSDFFAMGGYAVYVWSCYGISATVLGLMVYFSVSAHRRAKLETEELEGQSRRSKP